MKKQIWILVIIGTLVSGKSFANMDEFCRFDKGLSASQKQTQYKIAGGEAGVGGVAGFIISSGEGAKAQFGFYMAIYSILDGASRAMVTLADRNPGYIPFVRGASCGARALSNGIMGQAMAAEIAPINLDGYTRESKTTLGAALRDDAFLGIYANENAQKGAN